MTGSYSAGAKRQPSSTKTKKYFNIKFEVFKLKI